MAGAARALEAYAAVRKVFDSNTNQIDYDVGSIDVFGYGDRPVFAISDSQYGNSSNDESGYKLFSGNITGTVVQTGPDSESYATEDGYSVLPITETNLVISNHWWNQVYWVLICLGSR